LNQINLFYYKYINNHNNNSSGTWVDCLVGQWWAHSLGLGYILKKENVASTLLNVFEKNHVKSFVPGRQCAVDTPKQDHREPKQCFLKIVNKVNRGFA
jgi:uncharacterized protein (DUF608 family)